MKKFPHCVVTVGKEEELEGRSPIRHLSLALIVRGAAEAAAPLPPCGSYAGAGYWCQCHTSEEMGPHTPSQSMQRPRSIT